MDSASEEVLITWVSRLAINEAFLSAFGITLPSNCGGKKKKKQPTDQVEAEPELRLERGGAKLGGWTGKLREAWGPGGRSPTSCEVPEHRGE